MLRMSKLADYGTVVMTFMARQSRGMWSASEISVATGLEPPTVSKLLKLLLRARLLTSQRGSRGGYALARTPQEISVAEIIDAIEGQPMGLTECSSVPGLCTREHACAVRANWRYISQAIREILEGVTLAELAQPLPQVIGLERSRPPGQAAAPRAAGETLEEVRHEHCNQATG